MEGRLGVGGQALPCISNTVAITRHLLYQLPAAMSRPGRLNSQVLSMPMEARCPGTDGVLIAGQPPMLWHDTLFRINICITIENSRYSCCSSALPKMPLCTQGAQLWSLAVSWPWGLILLDDHDVPRSPHQSTVPPTRMDSDMQKHLLGDTDVPLDD